MTVTELLQELKERLKERKSAFVITEDWNGDTEGGFYTTHEFDLEKLYAQMDKFGEELRQRGVPEHLATQPQAAWQPIETAPETTESKGVLLGGKFGVHLGKVFNYGGGDIVVVIAHIAGNSVEGISHFMVIPAAFKEPS